MLVLCKHIIDEINKGRDAYLVALIGSEGSAPRGRGARLLADAEGLVCGTVGGGAMEYAAIKLAQEMLASGAAENFTRIFDLAPGAGAGMICGGRCELAFVHLAADERTRAEAERIMEYIGAGRSWLLLLPLAAGRIRACANLALADDDERVNIKGKIYYAERQLTDGRVYVFGAGHVARELVPLLAHLDFRCVVLDDRPEFARRDFFPEAEGVLPADFAHLAGAFSLDADDYAVVMTRGHEHDAQCERFLLGTPAGYIGIMGSKSKARLTREALLAEGFTEQELARVITPVGIDIASETPAEIAVSIAAQLIAVRAKKKALL